MNQRNGKNVGLGKRKQLPVLLVLYYGTWGTMQSGVMETIESRRQVCLCVLVRQANVPLVISTLSVWPPLDSYCPDTIMTPPPHLNWHRWSLSARCVTIPEKRYVGVWWKEVVRKRTGAWSLSKILAGEIMSDKNLTRIPRFVIILSIPVVKLKLQ